MKDYFEGKGKLYWTTEKTNSYANEAFKLLGGLAALATLASCAFVPALPFAFTAFVVFIVLHYLTLPRGYAYETSGPELLSRRIDTSTLRGLSERYREAGEEGSWAKIVDYYRSVRTPEEFCLRVERELSRSMNADRDREEIAQGLADARAPQPFLQFLAPRA